MNTNSGFSARMILVGFVLALIWTGPNAGAIEGVSPGAADRLAQVNNTCPTFNGDGEAGAVMNELVAYELPEGDEAAGVELTADAEVLFTRVPGGASSWTPSADQCFAPGGRFVWFVRAVSELAGDQVIEASDWSAGLVLHGTRGAFGRGECSARWTCCGGWDAANGGGSLMLSSAAATVTAAAPVPAGVADAGAVSGTGSGSSHPKSIPTASAAIRGEHPDTTGEKYGIVGTSASLDGAGLAAANTAGGPDLVLDGSVNGEVDTQIYQRGLTRESADSENFAFAPRVVV